jgi:acyl-CoA thioester hydrolase
LRVRWGECDPQGIVFNPNYLLYLDVAFTEWMRTLFGPATEVIARGVDVVMAETNVRFRAAARFDGDIEIGLTPTRLGRGSLTTSFTISRDGTLLTEGWTRHVFVSAKTLEKIAVPHEMGGVLAPLCA